jgi:hypothetical protein
LKLPLKAYPLLKKISKRCAKVVALSAFFLAHPANKDRARYKQFISTKIKYHKPFLEKSVETDRSAGKDSAGQTRFTS